MDLMVTIELDTGDLDPEAVLPVLSAALTSEAGAAFAVAEHGLSVTLTGRGDDAAQGAGRILASGVADAMDRYERAVARAPAQLRIRYVSAEKYPETEPH